MPFQGGMQNLTQTFLSASLAQHIPQQPLQMMPSPPQQATYATPSGTTQPYLGKSAWNDVSFASSTQQTVRKPLVVTPPHLPTPRMQPQIAPPVPQQPMQVQTPLMQPQMMPGGGSAVHSDNKECHNILILQHSSISLSLTATDATTDSSYATSNGTSSSDAALKGSSSTNRNSYFATIFSSRRSTTCSSNNANTSDIKCTLSQFLFNK